nr:N-6 DNA methylase [Lachnoclostridium sp. Marseille-P6806]
MSKRHFWNLLGRTYEYCIAQFAEVEGKGGGEFYTPASVVKTLVSILKPFSNCRVYDPCCGFRVIIMTEANSSVKSKVLKLLPKLKTEETDGLCVA